MFNAGIVAAMVGMSTIVLVFFVIVAIELVAKFGVRQWTRNRIPPKSFERSSISASSVSQAA